MSIPKLSEAIRLGIGLFPQGTSWCNCTLGTALAAVGRNWYYHKPAGMPYVEVLEVWPWLQQKAPSGARWKDEIEAMNGFDEEPLMTRERIADFVATIEQQLEAQATPQLEVEHVQN